MAEWRTATVLVVQRRLWLHITDSDIANVLIARCAEVDPTITSARSSIFAKHILEVLDRNLPELLLHLSVV